MLKVSDNFDSLLVKRHNRNNYIIWSIVGVSFLCAATLLILTAWYKYDKAISEFFNRGMDIDFFKGWTAYTVIDGSVLLISFIIPLVFLMFESFFAFLRQNDSKISKHVLNNWIIFVYAIVLCGYVGLITWQLETWTFGDFGFGRGFDYWFIVGWEYTIPIFVVSLLVNFAICFSLTWWIHFRLAKRERFLQLGYWRRGTAIILFLVLMYVPVLLLKMGLGRPYLINIDWVTYLNKIKDYDYSRYDHYIHQDTFNYGWRGYGNNTSSFPTDLDWSWTKMGKGQFLSNKSKPWYWNDLPDADFSFPSGHMSQMQIIISMLLCIFMKPQTGKQETARMTIFGVAVFWTLNMFFSLDMSLNHWTSDMAFSLVWGPLAFIIASLITYHGARLIHPNLVK